MSVLIQSEGEPKRCASCYRPEMLEFYTCSTCPPLSHANSYDLCMSCSDNYAREAHNQNMGPNHTFLFARVGRWCDWCRDAIIGDFMMCKACPQGMNAYDLCLTCAMSRQPIQVHTASTQHRELRYVQWQPSEYLGDLKAFQTFRLNWVWNCDGNLPQCAGQMNAPFFHCMDCRGNGFDLCACCADRGGIARHRSNTAHRFAFVMQTKPVPKTSAAGNDEAPPPYTAW